LCKRYRDPLGTRLYTILLPTFSEFNNNQNVELESYAKNLDTVFNQDQNALRKFAFKIFAMTHDDKLTENDMFMFM